MRFFNLYRLLFWPNISNIQNIKKKISNSKLCILYKFYGVKFYIFFGSF